MGTLGCNVQIYRFEYKFTLIFLLYYQELKALVHCYVPCIRHAHPGLQPSRHLRSKFASQAWNKQRTKAVVGPEVVHRDRLKNPTKWRYHTVSKPVLVGEINNTLKSHSFSIFTLGNSKRSKLPRRAPYFACAMLIHDPNLHVIPDHRLRAEPETNNIRKWSLVPTLSAAGGRRARKMALPSVE